MKKVSTNLVVKIALAIIVGITGLLTVIFAILNLAGTETIDSSAILRIMIGVLLIIIGISTSLLTIFANPEAKSFDLLSGALFIGIGIYFFVEDHVLNNIAALLFPLIIACLGLLMLIKSIADLVKKSGNKTILTIIISIIFLVAGICFAVFYKNVKLQSVIWLLLGIGIIVLSIGEIVFTLKGQPKVKILKDKE